MEKLIEALKKIAQMSDPGDPMIAVVRMKSIASDAISALSASGTGEEWIRVDDGLPEDIDNCFWCAVPVVEPPYVGSMCDEGFKLNHYTHWKKLENNFFPAPPTK